MKRTVLFFITLTSLSLTGCHPESDDIPVQTGSRIIVKASNAEVEVMVRSGAPETVVFTGDDILWFNETTKELCFKNNFSNSPANNSALYATQAVRFYMDDEYLFSSMIYVSDLSSQTFNSLVFYYNVTENRYFLRDGYPDAAVLSNPQKAQELRDENRQKIAPEWDRFIEQLKLEGRYKN
ncbi:MAG: hypothetical protein LBL57_05285 [Tannerella sp.]|jgi:hypothetical protein|nr:hypothetical protein [Tannerella sp.]